MATGQTVVSIDHTDDVTIDTSDKNKTVAAVRNILDGIAAGSRAGSLDVKQNGGTGVAAAGTLTAAGVLAADTCAINGVVFTAVTGAAAAEQFDRSGTDAQTATNLAAAINASANALVRDHVTAAAAGAVVTVTAKNKGATGNAITLAGTAVRLVASVARLAGGVTAAAAKLTF